MEGRVDGVLHRQEEPTASVKVICASVDCYRRKEMKSEPVYVYDASEDCVHWLVITEYQACHRL
jgi:hypothetical protein